MSHCSTNTSRGRGRWLECGDVMVSVSRCPGASQELARRASSIPHYLYSYPHNPRPEERHRRTQEESRAWTRRAGSLSCELSPCCANIIVIYAYMLHLLLRWWENVESKMGSLRISLSFLPGRRLERGDQKHHHHQVKTTLQTYFCTKMFYKRILNIISMISRFTQH